MNNWALVCNTEMVAELYNRVGRISDCRSRVGKSKSQLSHITFVEIVREIISVVSLCFLLIQEVQLSLTVKTMCTKYWLTAERTEPAQVKC